MMKYYEQEAGKKEILKKGKSTFLNKIIFNHQFGLNIKSLFSWSIIVAILMAVVLAIYPSISEMYASVPEEMMEILIAMGGGFSNIGEYFVIEGGQIYVLVGAVFAAILGMSLIGKEIKDGSSEFLYTHPVSKGTIYRSKLCVLIVDIIIFNLFIIAVSLITIGIVTGFSTFSLVNFLIYALLATILHLEVGLIVYSLTAVFKTKISMGIGLGLSIAFYFIALIAKIASEIQILEIFTPFTLVLAKIMEEGFSSVNANLAIIWGGISIVSILYSHYYFKRNDILV